MGDPSGEVASGPVIVRLCRLEELTIRGGEVDADATADGGRGGDETPWGDVPAERASRAECGEITEPVENGLLLDDSAAMMDS